MPRTAILAIFFVGVAMPIALIALILWVYFGRGAARGGTDSVTYIICVWLNLFLCLFNFKSPGSLNPIWVVMPSGFAYRMLNSFGQNQERMFCYIYIYT